MVLMGINTPVKAETAVVDEFNSTESTGYAVLLEETTNETMPLALFGAVSEETE